MVRSSTVRSACLHCSCSRSRSWISSSRLRSLSISFPDTWTRQNQNLKQQQQLNACFMSAAAAAAYLSLQLADQQLQLLDLLVLLQQRLLQLLHPHLGVFTQLQVEVHFCWVLGGRLQSLAELETEAAVSAASHSPGTSRLNVSAPPPPAWGWCCWAQTSSCLGSLCPPPSPPAASLPATASRPETGRVGSASPGCPERQTEAQNQEVEPGSRIRK